MFRKLVFAALPLVLAVLTIGGQSAYAVGASIAVVEGSGNTTGLSINASAQNGSFGGTVVGGGALVQGTTASAAVVVAGSCSFTFQSTSATAALDINGTAQGTCGGGTQVGGSVTIDCSATASLSYKRVGITVVITGTCSATINGNTVSGTLAGLCIFIPTSPSTTITTFALVCASVGVTTQ